MVAMFTRRSVLRSSMALAAAGTLGRPYIANAEAKTATVWWVQGFFPEEDEAFKNLAAGYEKTSGNKLDYSIIPFAPMRQKIISAITSGVVPDLMYATPPEVVPEQAWAGKLVDVTDVIETQKAKFLPAAINSAYFYNAQEKKHSYYGVPFEGGVVPFHVWQDLVEEAGAKMSDIPKTWDAFIDFFPPLEKILRGKGHRHLYATAFVVSTIGNDPLNTFHAFLIAYGGAGLVTPDGKLHDDDPQVQEAVIKALDKLSSYFKDGHIPPGSVNWNDADDNNAFHAKLAIMDYDGTLSTELAMIHDEKAYQNMVTMGRPLTNDGKQQPSIYGVNNAIIPTGAKNVEVAKDFMKYAIQPDVDNTYLKGALCRWLPVYGETTKNDPFWTDPKDPHRAPYVKMGIDEPTIPEFFVYNPAYAQCRTEHIFNVAWADIVSNGMSTKDAADKALKRAKDIFAKYPIQQT